jgi:hypothetical protein
MKEDLLKDSTSIHQMAREKTDHPNNGTTNSEMNLGAGTVY